MFPCLWSPPTSSHHQSHLLTPNTAALPFPSDVEIHTLHSTYPPFNFYFGPNIAEETICVFENTMYQSHQKPRKQKLPLVTALSFHVYHVAVEGGAVYSGLSNTVKAKRTYRLAHSARTETSGLLCSQLQ